MTIDRRATIDDAALPLSPSERSFAHRLQNATSSCGAQGAGFTQPAPTTKTCYVSEA
ncbi:hypothetical protein [Methylobacterium sp. 10]|uniref:hypothetical protein n=1 Tax=Methylobacterium sp. 10 TaxID=1101191 RepID=UPI0012DD9642|nr:hypothetical protein [Methylobacterium sp. 10]